MPEDEKSPKSLTLDPLVSIHDAVVFDSRDWAGDKASAWVYGVVVGWGDALPAVASRFGWDAATQQRLTRLRERYSQAQTARAP